MRVGSQLVVCDCGRFCGRPWPFRDRRPVADNDRRDEQGNDAQLQRGIERQIATGHGGTSSSTAQDRMKRRRNPLNYSECLYRFGTDTIHRPDFRAFLFFAIDLLAALMALLRLDRQGRDRAGVKTLQADRLAGILAVAVGSVLDPAQRRVDFGNQLALPVTRPQLGGAVGFGRGAVGEIGVLRRVFVQDRERLAGLAQDLVFQSSSRLRK